MKQEQETQESIASWAIQTFGEPESGVVLIEKLKEEIYELAAACVVYDNIVTKAVLEKILDEIADVTIIAYQVCNWYGISLHDRVTEKMKKNRNRVWKIVKSGIGKHIEEEKK